MKFLCDNCKAKYQIPDEKVAGRTLRMTCRKCGNDILIRGAGVTPSVAPPAAAPTEAAAPQAAVPKKAPAVVSKVAPVPMAAAKTSSVPAKASSVPTKAAGVPAKAAGVPAKAPGASAKSAGAASAARPSALGADFRKKVGNEDAGSLRTSAAAPMPQATEEWHVAVNDVPVGPIQRDEIARKIGTGAVTGDSLAWREGFDDWRPIREIPQLASLLDQRRRPSVPPATRTGGSGATPRPTGPRGRPGSGAFTLPTSDRSSANLVPVGGRAAAPVAPPGNMLPDAPGQDDFALDFASPSSIPPAPVAPTASQTAPAVAAPIAVAASTAANEPAYRERESSQKTPVWVWGMLAGGIFFGVVLGMKGSEWFGAQEPATVAVADTPSPDPTPDPVVPPLEVPEETDTVDAGAPESEPEAETSTGHSRSGSSTSRAPTPTAPTMAATAMADDAAFAQFESVGSSANPSSIGTTMSAAAAPPLEASAVQRVVNNNRRALQTCYERAARGQANPPRARMDVNVTVGRSGTVTAVNATGNDFGGLGSCIEQSVRRWRFPASSDGGSTRFPVVFSAGG
ncbi:MAG: GYF domain-containing protein [Polyangiales bacterium]|nr:zinc-ribbon domain-containing protein [Myxococcales bacterium]MCB9660802.1 zinc-ribbon domain-containing protein [Sandaracinaceae bacterium]